MTKESTSSANLPFLIHVSLYSRIIVILSLLLSKSLSASVYKTEVLILRIILEYAISLSSFCL